MSQNEFCRPVFLYNCISKDWLQNLCIIFLFCLLVRFIVAATLCFAFILSQWWEIFLCCLTLRAAASCSNCSSVKFFNCWLIHFSDKSFGVVHADIDWTFVCTLTWIWTDIGVIWIYNCSYRLSILSLRGGWCVLQSCRRAVLPRAQTVAFSLDSVASQHAQLGSCHWHIAMLLPGPDTVSSWWMDHCHCQRDQRHMSFLQCSISLDIVLAAQIISWWK